MRSSALWVPFYVTFLALTGCSGANDLPLGGPYGGTAGTPTAPDGGGSDGASAIVTTTATTTTTGVTLPGTGTGTGATTTTTTTTTTAGETTTGMTTTSSTTTAVTSTTMTTTTTTSTTTVAPAITWSYLYTTYLEASGTPGQCDGSCHHHSQCSSASACYQWIGHGYQLGTGGDLFSWDSGGFMPTHGPSSLPQADTDFDAWIAAGSQDN